MKRTPYRYWYQSHVRKTNHCETPRWWLELMKWSPGACTQAANIRWLPEPVWAPRGLSGRPKLPRRSRNEIPPSIISFISPPPLPGGELYPETTPTAPGMGSEQWASASVPHTPFMICTTGERHGHWQNRGTLRWGQKNIKIIPHPFTHIITTVFPCKFYIHK